LNPHETSELSRAVPWAPSASGVTGVRLPQRPGERCAEPGPGAGDFVRRRGFSAGGKDGDIISGDLPSGKHTKNYGKSQFLMGKSTIYGKESIVSV